MSSFPDLPLIATASLGLASDDLKIALLVLIGLFGAYFVVVWLTDHRQPATAKSSSLPIRAPSAAECATGFVTVFFDTLGIGSFATTTAIFRAWRLVPDELIPGTLNVGHTISSVGSAFIFIGLVPVAPATLLSMIAAAGLGAWLGAGVVAHLPRYRIRLGMGAALLVAVAIMLFTQLGFIPGGSDALGLDGLRLAIAVLANFVLGGLMTLGIGLYAPCMIVVSLLGMDARAAFPIMMGSCAFLLPISGARFLREHRFHPSAALGLTIGGLPALLIAAYLVKSLPLTAVRWLVIVVVLYTAITLVRAGRRELAGRRASLPGVVMQPD
jgi:uncharacterized membrane protein YfcA